MRGRAIIVLIAIFCVVDEVAAQSVVNRSDTLSLDYSPIDYVAVMEQLNRASQPTAWQRFSDWLFKKQDIEEEQTRNLRVDGGIGVGYTQETNAMFVASVVGRYLLKSGDESLPYSVTSLTGLVSANGSFRAVTSSDFALSGHDCVSLYIGGGSMPANFWGLGYEAADNNHVSQYVRKDFQTNVEYVRRIVGGLSVGANLDFRYAAVDKVESLAWDYLQNAGMKNLSAAMLGAGATVKYDGRTERGTQINGVFLQLRGAAYPAIFACNDDTIWHVEVTADYYQPLWAGGELALDLYADLWSWNTPWMFWAKVGGENRMRGYYYGRYTDRKMATAQIELRQKIYKALSCAAWMGAGSVFSSHKLFDIDNVLPNYGLGVRVALAKNLTLRVDYGFGRHSHGLIINVNEAF